jgi:hypothetical protein
VGGEQDGGVGDAGLAGQHHLGLATHRFHRADMGAVGQQGCVCQTIFDLDGLDQTGCDDVTPARGIGDGAQAVAQAVWGRQGGHALENL